ncbi:MAG: hypothetical protein LBL62_00060 [Planctomycetaceae bacterium]|jgi:hypothetical protein|nr:hypothetical protein [Planctomycetaceae bacterium]
MFKESNVNPSPIYTQAVLKFTKRITEAQQREAVTRGRSLLPYRLRYICGEKIKRIKRKRIFLRLEFYSVTSFFMHVTLISRERLLIFSIA